MDNFDRLKLSLLTLLLAASIIFDRWHTDEIKDEIQKSVVAKDRQIDSLKTKLDYCKGRY